MPVDNPLWEAQNGHLGAYCHDACHWDDDETRFRIYANFRQQLKGLLNQIQKRTR